MINLLEQGNKSAFARQVGVLSGAIGDLLGQRKTKPGYDMLKRFLDAYPQVSAEWLMRGTGEMLKLDNNFSQSRNISVVREEEPAPYKGAGPRILAVQVGPDSEENIELVSVRAAAGYASGGFHENDFIEKLPSFRLPDAAYRNGSFRAFQVSGDSMLSTLYEGDWVICRYIEDWDRGIRDMYVHVVVTEETVLVKRVASRLTERGQLALHSDNAAYPIQFMDGEHVREVWVAVGKLSRQFVNPRYDVNLELARLSESVQQLMDWKNRTDSREL